MKGNHHFGGLLFNPTPTRRVCVSRLGLSHVQELHPGHVAQCRNVASRRCTSGTGPSNTKKTPRSLFLHFFERTTAILWVLRKDAPIDGSRINQPGAPLAAEMYYSHISQACLRVMVMALLKRTLAMVMVALNRAPPPPPPVGPLVLQVMVILQKASPPPLCPLVLQVMVILQKASPPLWARWWLSLGPRLRESDPGWRAATTPPSGGGGVPFGGGPLADRNHIYIYNV